MEGAVDTKAKELAYWLCPIEDGGCGEKTIQPEGPQYKIITHCKCGRAFNKILEPDGVITEHVPAPQWLIDEVKAQDQKLNGLDTQFRQMSWQYFGLAKQIAEVQQKILDGQKHMHNIFDNGAQRMKLLKRKDMHWEYNPFMNRFLGWPKGKRGTK